MKTSEICQGVIDGTIEIDCCGHRCNDPKPRLVDWFNHTTEYANGKGDGGWNKEGRDDGKTVEERDADMRAHYQRELDNEPGPDDPLSFMQMEIYCFSCGRTMKLVPRGNKLELRHWFDPEAPSERWGKGAHAVDEGRCAYEDEPPYGGEIEIKSSLVVGNFFVGLKDDCPEEEKYGHKYDLNCHRGQASISQWKRENQKIAYGQMTNTSIGIFVNDEGTSVIIGPAYLADTRADDLSEEEYDALTDEDWERLRTLEGHKQVGEVSLSVWRWEASDKDNLGEHYQATLDAEHAENPVDIKVVPGTWRYTHYFATGKHSDEIYARLEKVDAAV